MKKQILICFAVALFAIPAGKAFADGVPVAGASASPTLAIEKEDERISRLTLYLETHDSPLAPMAAHFIAEADRLGLDWKLVAAIAGVESTFGKHIPRNSYNGWGWGIFTGQNDGIHFKDWKDGITTVSEGLKKNYVDRGAVSVEQMGRIYAASPTWSMKVRFFMEKIEAFAPVGVSHLAVTI